MNLNRACSEIENATEDTAIALAEIADDHVFFETQKNHAKDNGNRLYSFEWYDSWCCCKQYLKFMMRMQKL